MSNKKEWPLWEVFIRGKQGLNHKHVGSLRASDHKMAVDNARDVYTRRSEGVSIWVVESSNLYASDPDEAASFFEICSGAKRTRPKCPLRRCRTIYEMWTNEEENPQTEAKSVRMLPPAIPPTQLEPTKVTDKPGKGYRCEDKGKMGGEPDPSKCEETLR